jgi:hypothetical protein
MAKESEMRKHLFSITRTSALTNRLASPFLRGQVPSDASVAKSHGRTGRGDTLMTDREFADAAVRFCRTLW